MHVNPGGRTGIPAFEREAYEQFSLRHLGSAASSPRGRLRAASGEDAERRSASAP